MQKFAKYKYSPSYIKVPDAIYLVTSHTVNFYPFFYDSSLARILKVSIAKAQKKLFFSLYAWAILHHHFHLLLKPRENINLSKTMHRIKGTAAYQINRFRNCRGTVWQDRFQAKLIYDERQLGTVINYINFNAVRHGLVTRPEDWPFSSYQLYRNKGYY